ncbi:hypothetical protein GC197_14595 [bacterium]|nr:hypothetical protein [bacterium]
MRLFTQGLSGIDWAQDVIGCLLLQTTSEDPAAEYQFDADHAVLSDLFNSGAVEINVAGYARAALTTISPVIDAAGDQVVFDAEDLDFGQLGAGQNVYALVLYRQGNDDTDSTLIAFGNGYVPVIAAADAASGATSIWVEPLWEDLPAGVAVDFSGGASGTLASAASRGDRSITIAAPGIAADVSAGDRCESVRTTKVSVQATPPALAYLTGGDFRVTFDSEGVFTLQERGNA